MIIAPTAPSRLNRGDYFALVGLLLLSIHFLSILVLLIGLVVPEMFGVNEQWVDDHMESAFKNPVFMVFFMAIASLQIIAVGMVLYSFYVLKIRRRWFYWSMQIAVVMMLGFIPPIGFLLAIKITQYLKNNRTEFRSNSLVDAEPSLPEFPG